MIAGELRTAVERCGLNKMLSRQSNGSWRDGESYLDRRYVQRSTQGRSHFIL